jgi:hypothetical protein
VIESPNVTTAAVPAGAITSTRAIMNQAPLRAFTGRFVTPE